MKITTKMKIVIPGIAVLLALSGTGFLVWNSHQSAIKLSNSTSIQSDQKVPLKSQKKSPASKIHTSNITDGQNKDKQKNTQLDKASAQTDSYKAINQSKNESQPENKSLKTMAGENQASSPEIQKKSELYTQLASILPEFRRIDYEMGDISHNENLSEEMMQRDEILSKRKVELMYNIRDTCISILKPPAITQIDGEIMLTNFDTVFTQIASYLGKELPFDGNTTNYFTAKDYQGGTGGW